jgi:signal-transduction protein with cAMP-binding, CBS, and nucleotidyltransferase domain
MKDILYKYMSRWTSLNEEDQQVIMDEIRIEQFKKGTVLFKQGDVPTECYFILKSCVRQYSIDEEGRISTPKSKLSLFSIITNLTSYPTTPSRALKMR